MTKLTDSPAWDALYEHSLEIVPSALSVKPKSFEIKLDGLCADLSRHWMQVETLPLLVKLAEQQKLADWRGKMFKGDKINHTEDRAVWHVRLRDNQLPEVKAVKDRLYRFADKVRAEKKFKSIVNIGIGGSDLGPRLVTESLRPFHDTDMEFHFVSNIDAADLMEVLKKCDPATTLFIVSSKTFTTIETLTNAHTARSWLVKSLGEKAVADHFVAAAAAADKVKAFGIDPENMFEFWDWVGGRYSVWSAIGLPVILAIGPRRFEEFLAGAHEMDEHFKNAPMAQNLPVLMGLLGVWYRNFFSLGTLAILPYDQYLQNLPRYLQQLDMESNGKSVDRDGVEVDYHTAPIIFGEPGTNGQHAFYQLLHQGTSIVPCDFIVTHKSAIDTGDHRKILVANALAQPDALWQGRVSDDPYKNFHGRRPSTILHVDELSSRSLGMLLALYEHKIFVQGVLWNLNSFDQFGVQLGKDMANSLLAKPV
jgi:glucose-6-phosphate isomerase